jgi:hypothetical protein
MVVHFHIRAELKGEILVADLVRYHTTGEKAPERIEAARRASCSDSAVLRDVKQRFNAMPLEDRKSFRPWLIETDHIGDRPGRTLMLFTESGDAMRGAEAG